MMHYGSGYGFLGMFVGAAFWILIIVGGILLAKWFLEQEASQATNGGESAQEILKKRYAKGEMDKDEFEERKRTLNED